MKLRSARVCASQRRSRRKTPHFNLLRNPEPTTTPAGRVVLTVFAGVAQFERSLIGIRTEEGRRTAQARDVPFERPSKLRPDQRILARQLIEQEGQSVSEVAQPSISMPQRFFAASRSGDLMTVHRSSRTHGPTGKPTGIRPWPHRRALTPRWVFEPPGRAGADLTPRGTRRMLIPMPPRASRIPAASRPSRSVRMRFFKDPDPGGLRSCWTLSRSAPMI